MDGKPFQTIDEYIATFPADVQALLKQMRQTIHEAAPEAEEAIRCQMPTFRLHGNLVHFAAFRNHIGLYPAPSGIEAFEQELAPIGHPKARFVFRRTNPFRWIW